MTSYRSSFRWPFLVLALLVGACAGPSRVRLPDDPNLVGYASYYHPSLRGRRTANGERYNPKAMTAAHRTLPFGTKLTVVNMQNGKRVTVRINDRGPFVAGRIIDLSSAAAKKLGMMKTGVARVRLAIRKD